MTKLYDEIDYLPGPIIYKPTPQAPDAGVVAELVEAMREMIAAQDPEAGEMARKLSLQDARAALAKMETRA